MKDEPFIGQVAGNRREGGLHEDRVFADRVSADIASVGRTLKSPEVADTPVDRGVGRGVDESEESEGQERRRQWRDQLVSMVSSLRGLGRRSGLSQAKQLLVLWKLGAGTLAEHRWGDFVVGGGLGLLDLAVEMESVGLIRRCLASGCLISDRTRLLAWRSGNAKVIAFLDRMGGDVGRVWPDEALEKTVTHETRRMKSNEERRHLQRTIAGGHGLDESWGERL